MSTETWTSVEKFYARTRNNIFKKKKNSKYSNIRFWIIYILIQISFFRGLLSGVDIQLSQLGVDLIQEISC